MAQAKTVHALAVLVDAYHEATTLEFANLRTQITDSEARILAGISQNGIGPKAKLGAKKTTGLAVAGLTPVAAIGYLFVESLLARL